VNFSNIATIAKLKVPPMAISSFQKKVATAKAPFDVFVEEDSTAGKGRIVVKKIPPSDITIEWEDRSGGGADLVKNVLKVKAELASLTITNNTYLKQILAEKEKVKNLKEVIKGIEGAVPNAQVEEIVKRIGEARSELQKVDAAGKEVQGKHDGWYLNGPRGGINPILKKFGIDPKDLEQNDANAFAKALHEMSAAANEVRKVYDVDIHNAAAALITRLDNLESTVTKSGRAALAEIRKSLADEVAKLRIQAEKNIVEMKVEKTQNLMDQLKDANSVAYKRLKANPSTIKVEMESNKVRINNIPKFLDLVNKQASRIKKGVPSEFARDFMIAKQFEEMDKLSQQNTKALSDARLLLEQCDRDLTEFAKQIG
jgi:hypothetical protein